MPPHTKLLASLQKLKALGQAWLEWRRQRCGRFSRSLALLAIGLLLALLAVGWYRVEMSPNAWAVVVNGEQVALVSSRQQAEEAVSQLLAGRGQGLKEVRFTDRIEYRSVRAEKKDLSREEQLKKALAEKLHIVAKVVALRINGQNKVIVSDRVTAQAVLEELKKSSIPQGEGEIEEVTIQEDVSLLECEVDPDKVLSAPEALAILKAGRLKVDKYIVKEGDSFWTIARDNGLTVEQLEAANPGVNSERLSIGQEINLNKVEPLLHVVAVIRKEVKEAIPYEVKIVNDHDLLRGQERIQQAGEEGEQRVVYQVIAKNGVVVGKEVLEKEVLKEPQSKIIKRGTRLVLASRGGGTGNLAWPVVGIITSGFGYRGHEFHGAIDIGVPYGTPVQAAEAGSVIAAGYFGGYGRNIIIDHGEGVVTRYAHLSGYEVKVGDKVERGQVIGYSGSSGRSTGPHLHFEVLINGVAHNPLEFLR